MVLRVLTEKEIKDIYCHDMQRDFPKSEIKPLKTIIELRKYNYYQCYGGFEHDRICAYLFLVWEHKELAMLDYFAVLPEFREKGIGKKILSLVSLEMKQEDFSGILIEIERISMAKNKKEKLIRTKRKNFYLQAGCIESGLTSEIFGVGYEILYLLLTEKQVNYGKDTFHKQVLTLQEIEYAYTEIYHRIVKKEYYDENVFTYVD